MPTVVYSKIVSETVVVKATPMIEEKLRVKASLDYKKAVQDLVFGTDDRTEPGSKPLG